ncbi:hypothetical protein [Planctomicrobium piriforme]|nr:hypothetical protein [Planctomicrobium piriforme]
MPDPSSRIFYVVLSLSVFPLMGTLAWWTARFAKNNDVFWRSCGISQNDFKDMPPSLLDRLEWHGIGMAKVGSLVTNVVVCAICKEGIALNARNSLLFLSTARPILIAKEKVSLRPAASQKFLVEQIVISSNSGREVVIEVGDLGYSFNKRLRAFFEE